MKYIYVSIIFLIVFTFFSEEFKQAYDAFVNLNMCIDTGICNEGIKTKIDGVLIEINEENCKKYKKIWNSENSTCIIKNN